MGRALNIFTAIILIAMVGLLGWLGYTLLQPAPVDPDEQVVLPTIVVIPTLTPSMTSRPTLPPTFTPTFTISPTVAPSSTPTFTPSVSPTITDTPSRTPTPVSSATPTPTQTFTPSPTSSVPTNTPTATLSPFPFEVRGASVEFVPNTYNNQGCAFQAVAGQVFGTDNNPITSPVVVVVTGQGGFEGRQTSGNSTAYGPAGYEIPVNTRISPDTYLVQIQTALGTQISEIFTVTFPSNCDGNVAIINWRQTRPF